MSQRWLCVHVSSMIRLFFTLKFAIFSTGFFNESSLIVAWRFRIQDSRFKKESMKMSFQNNLTDERKSKYVSIIALLWGFYFTQKLVLCSAGIFRANSLIVACYSFGRFKIWTPNRFQSKSNDTSNLLPATATIYKNSNFCLTNSFR